MADHLRTDLVTAALAMALRRRRPAAGLIHHSDRGCQDPSLAFGQQLREAGILPSVSSPGDCFDNAVAEAFFATIKVEVLHRLAWPTRAAAQLAIFDSIEGWYNRRLRHSTLGYATPIDFEALAREPAVALYLVQVACRHTGVVDRHRHGRPRPELSAGRGTRLYQSPDS